MPLTYRSYNLIGWLLITSAISLLIPYTLLGYSFDYPNILRLPAGDVLTRFHAGGPALIATWFAFATVGLPLLVAYVFIGELFKQQVGYLGLATKIGVASVIVQWIGLLRWTFVVPALANAYVGTTNESERQSIAVVFMAFHQFGGVLLGEHIGQLLTIAWSVMISFALFRLHVIPQWVMLFGVTSSGIYLLAQSELLATVMPSFPALDWAGFVGSTLWLVWLIILGIFFLRLHTAKG